MYTHECRSWNALIDIHTTRHITHARKLYWNYPEFYLLFGYFMRCKHVYSEEMLWLPFYRFVVIALIRCENVPEVRDIDCSKNIKPQQQEQPNGSFTLSFQGFRFSNP